MLLAGTKHAVPVTLQRYLAAKDQWTRPSSTRRFRYAWCRTWDDKAEDYVAHDGVTSIGRVYRINSISAGGWFWTCNGTLGNMHGSYSGQVADRDEAA